MIRIEKLLQLFKQSNASVYFGNIYFHVSDYLIQKRFGLLKSAGTLLKQLKWKKKQGIPVSTFENIVANYHHQLIVNKELYFLDNVEFDVNINNESDVLY